MRLRVVGESGSDDCLVSTVRFAMAWELIPRVATEGFVVGQSRWRRGLRKYEVECAETRCLVSWHNACWRAIQRDPRLDGGRQSQRWKRTSMREPE